jgi:hypothetical protein
MASEEWVGSVFPFFSVKVYSQLMRSMVGFNFGE